MSRNLWIAVLVALCCSAAATPAAAAPVATSDPQYQALGRVFPDPLGACQHIGQEPCSPHAQGNVSAMSFIQWQEFVDALRYMNGNSEWQRYLEVLPLDGKMGDYAAGEPVNTDGREAFPGNTLSELEFTPRKENVSAGVPTTDLERKRSDLYVLRVTDETVPDEGKKRMTLALSIHGIERAGLEGGTRAMEDLVTAFTTGKHDDPVVPAAAKEGAPTFADVLRNTIVYFTYPNPDGWRRGSITDGGLSFQRYNGNGVDPNRDWPDIGYSFRGYSGASEPETRAFMGFYDDVRAGGAKFDAGDDLHGQPFADALSYTMLPHGRHDLGKDTRLRETAKTIHTASYEALKWSPMIQPDDAEPGGGLPCVGGLGDTCARIYGQTWGTVYDTINYTTTGTLGDWFDSRVGLDADGIDNEMSFSHIDKDTRFDPHTEQLHVDGNKALIYAHLSDMLNPVTATLDAPGRQGYVPSPRLKREEQELQAPAPPGTRPQDTLTRTGAPTSADGTTLEFDVQRSEEIYNGGMRVDVTTTNLQGIQPADLTITMRVQCRRCEPHDPESDKWITVAEDWNQAQLYARAGLTAAVNHPDPAADWRVVVDPQAGAVSARVEFSSATATSDGGYTTKGASGSPPRLRAYDVANTDVFGDLNQFIESRRERFAPVDPREVIAGRASLDKLETLVLADSLLPGYTGLYAGEPARASGPPTEGFEFASSGPSAPGQGPTSCARTPANSQWSPEFTIEPDDGNAAMNAEINWELPGDYDIFAQRREADGTWKDVKGGTSFALNSERVEVPFPDAGTWRIEVVNCSAVDSQWKGRVSFTALPAPPSSAYTVAEKDAWAAELRRWVAAGGRLVLTDGALRGLSEVTPVPATAVNRQTVYAGQVAFDKDGESDGDTLDHPLADDVDQPGARFNEGMRRQTFEPTPLGFAIQDRLGDDSASARQYDVDIAEFEKAKGTVAATSADAGTRRAEAVLDRVTVGEIPVGEGFVRVAGALLPQPETAHDHPLGLEPYALTYTGSILLCNLLDAECGVKPQSSDEKHEGRKR